jgi:hypothetical protein
MGGSLIARCISMAKRFHFRNCSRWNCKSDCPNLASDEGAEERHLSASADERDHLGRSKASDGD